MDKVLQSEPLSGRRFAATGIALEPAPFCERFSLRAGPGEVTEVSQLDATIRTYRYSQRQAATDAVLGTSYQRLRTELASGSR
ncbi:MAG: hypothetical protein AAF362_11675, partial [Pseudomonadota bacterium]